METMGIPIGPITSDLLAEVVLTAVVKDFEAGKNIRELDFIGIRYKDDFKILVKSKREAKVILKALAKSLSKFNLTINYDKTIVTKDFTRLLGKRWRKEYLKIPTLIHMMDPLENDTITINNAVAVLVD